MAAALGLGGEWRPAAGCPPVARERPGVSGRPVSPLREGLGPRLVVKAPPLPAGPGRNTAVQAAAWLAERRRHGR